MDEQKNLDNEILNELKQLNKNTYNLISLMKAREEDRLKDKQTQATKDSEQATLDSEQAVKTAESLEAEKVKQEADELQDKQRHAELVGELKKTSEAVGKMNLSEDQAEVLEEIKSVNENLQTVIEQQDSSTLVQENSFSLGTLAFAGFLFCIGAYAVLKLGGFVYSEITKKVFR
jgi:vacuolar-type H+-ATPase subunit I/STV1